MGKTRIDARKIKQQCKACGEFNGRECKQGLNCYCQRERRKRCGKYRKPSVIEAANELAKAAGIDINGATKEQDT